MGQQSRRYKDTKNKAVCEGAEDTTARGRFRGSEREDQDGGRMWYPKLEKLIAK